MNREVAVLLVSRALACIQGIYAVDDATYLPERLFSLHHYALLGQGDYLVSLYPLAVAFIFCRVAILLILTFAFWNCGPRIAQFLLPERKSSPPAS